MYIKIYIVFTHHIYSCVHNNNSTSSKLKIKQITLVLCIIQLILYIINIIYIKEVKEVREKENAKNNCPLRFKDTVFVEYMKYTLFTKKAALHILTQT